MNSTEYKQKEKYILENIFKTSEAIVEDQFSVNDAYIETEKMIVIGELKTRNFNSVKYDYLFLEMGKLKNLRKKAAQYLYKNKNIKVYYINSFEDDVILIFDLIQIFKLIKNNDEEMVYSGQTYMNYATADDFRCSNKKVKKDVYFLNKKLAKKIIMNYGLN